MSSATTDVTALHALRVCGLASTPRLADHLRAAPEATEALLRRCESEGLVRYRDGRDADPLSLPAPVDAAAPVILDLGEVGSATVELTVHVRARPAPGWLACRSTTRFVAGGFHEEDFEIWDAAGVLVAQSRQLALLP